MHAPARLAPTLAVLLLLTACDGAPVFVAAAMDREPSVPDAPTGGDVGPRAPVQPAPTFDFPAVDHHNTGDLATAQVCATCHANDDDAAAMRDDDGREIAPFDLWRASTMANAARDPFWWAMMAAEVDATPAARADIEATCLKCHAPMAGVHRTLTDKPPPARADLLTHTATGKLGIDGVSCTLCHQIQPDGLGTDASYTGGFVIAPERRIFGPHASPFSMPMRHHTGFTPAQADHVTSSALCGSCHTLQTETLTPDGTPLPGLFPEQATYLEWRNSDFRDEDPPGATPATCGACHMPTRDDDGDPIHTKIAHRPHGGDFPPIDRRSPYGRHLFVGGNTLLPALLRDHADALRPDADAAAFDAVIARVRDQLATRTATLEVTAARAGDELAIDATVTNLTGHKFPTGYPSRRAWLRVVVRDRDGAVVFRSGDVDARGRLVDRAGEPLPGELAGGPVQPHRREITADDAVQVYEAIMADRTGVPTFRLLRARSFARDNRLLPAGWRPDHPDAAHTGPVGPEGDPDFVPGRDTTRYRVHAPAGAGPHAIAVELLYQPLAPRFAAELFAVDAPEVRAFEALYDQADHAPEHVAAVDRVIP